MPQPLRNSALPVRAVFDRRLVKKDFQRATGVTLVLSQQPIMKRRDPAITTFVFWVVVFARVGKKQVVIGHGLSLNQDLLLTEYVG